MYVCSCRDYDSWRSGLFFLFVKELHILTAHSPRFLAFEGGYHMGNGVSWHTVPSIKRYLVRMLSCLSHTFFRIQEEVRGVKELLGG
jgi:hypothetical protein